MALYGALAPNAVTSDAGMRLYLPVSRKTIRWFPNYDLRLFFLSSKFNSNQGREKPVETQLGFV